MALRRGPDKPHDMRSDRRPPKVSVIIPLFNHEQYVGEAIRSVLEQSCSDLELLIIDDGSTDGSEAVVRGFTDGRLYYHRQENQGAHVALNSGVRMARGEYVSVLNSDDVYAPQRLEACIVRTDADDALAAVFSHVEFIDAAGDFLDCRRGREDAWRGLPDPTFAPAHSIVLELLAGNFLHTTSNLFCRRSVFDDVGMFSSLRYVHDYDFFLRLCYRCKVAVIEEPLLRYRFHESNTLGDDYAASNFETGLVLAKFLLMHDLSDLLAHWEDPLEAMTRFFNSIRTYDTDRQILTLLLFGMKYYTPDRLLGALAERPENLFRQACVSAQRVGRDAALLKDNLAWQREQADASWRKAEEAAAALEWQNRQTERWWRTAEELKTNLAWQAEQTTLWWRRSGELGHELREQASRVDELASQRNELQAENSRLLADVSGILSSRRWRAATRLASWADKLLPANTRRRAWLQRWLH
jgi:glycosyltransferase involved in cell wall biosynthesis